MDDFTIVNEGTIGNSAAGNLLAVGGSVEGDAVLKNNGQLIAANGANLTVTRVTVSGSGQMIATNGGGLGLLSSELSGSGQITVSNGGTLSLARSQIGPGQELNLGGQGATVLSFDPADLSIDATISGFDFTDEIELRNFLGTVTASDNQGPTFTFNAAPGSHGPASFSLRLNGNYTGSSFELIQDSDRYRLDFSCETCLTAMRTLKSQITVPVLPRHRSRALCHRRSGWRRLKLLLEREGIRMNHKKLRAQTCIGHACADDAATGTEPALVTGLCRRHTDRPETVPHPGGGRRLHCECLCLIADTSLSGARVARELTLLIARRGARPLLCVSDHSLPRT